MMRTNDSCFTGSVAEYIGHMIIIQLGTLITLGFAFPWLYVSFKKWMCKNTIIDGKQLVFDGTGTELFGQYIKWLILTFITLGIYSLWLFNKMTDWECRHTHLVD